MRVQTALKANRIVLWLALAGTASAAVQITSSSTLPNAAVGSPYTATLTASGGSVPYTWSITGNKPPGLTLTPAGVLSGTPTQAGGFTFTVTVTDNAGSKANVNFSLTATPAPLAITTLSPLFSATVGQSYVQQFQASGGSLPYTWSATGLPPTLTLDPTAGLLQGTPNSVATLSISVKVTDATGTSASAIFSLPVTSPPIFISTPINLPAAIVGVAYSQTLSATGGIPPLQWSLLGGNAPGITLNPATGVLSGTPTTVGASSLSIQVTDAVGTSASRTFILTVNAPTLSVSTPSPLTPGTAGAAYTQTMTAVGGVAPYTWSATGLPAGLTIDPGTGIIGGTPTAAGTFQVNIKLTDTSKGTYSNLFALVIALPTVPPISISGVSSSGTAGGQVPVQITIPQPYTAGDITGQISVTFTPSNKTPGDPTIQFSTGGTTATYTIKAGQTTAQFAVPTLSLSLGTLQGALSLTAQASAFGIDVTPSPAPSQSIIIAPAAPHVVSTSLTISGQNVTVQVIGFATTQQITQATFTFGSSGNTKLATATFTVPVTALFSAWYSDPNSAQFGSQFKYTQTFTVQGDPTAVTLQSVTLANALGNSN